MNKQEIIVCYTKDGRDYKCTLEEIMSYFKSMKIIRNDDSLLEYTASFSTSNGIFKYKEFNCDFDIMSMSNKTKEAYFLKHCGFQYLGIDKASIVLEDTETGEFIEHIVDYKKE